MSSKKKVDHPQVPFKRYKETAKFILNRFDGKPDVIFDIGANVGSFSICFSELLGNNVSIHSFEPIPDTYKELFGKLSKYNNITTHNFGLSDVTAEFSFGLPKTKKPKNSGRYSIHHDHSDVVKGKLVEAEQFCDEWLVKPDLIKLDAEGCESKILNSIDLSNCKLIYVEVNPSFDSSKQIHSILTSKNFKLIEDGKLNKLYKRNEA